jgi:hypothetical protein
MHGTHIEHGEAQRAHSRTERVDASDAQHEKAREKQNEEQHGGHTPVPCAGGALVT